MFGLKGSETLKSEHCLLKNVGVTKFNKQHLRLASYAVEFNEIVERLSTHDPDNREWKQIDALFSRISLFVATHFREEEEMMQAHNYPKYSEHKQLHEKFSKEMARIQSQINNRNLKFKGKLSSLLWDWLYNHINVVDYGYREFFVNKGVK